MLKGLNQQLAAMAPMREKRAAMIQKTREQEITPIDRYLATTPAPVLERPAIPKAPGDHRGFITEKDGGNKIVVLDESYLDKALPPQAAQVITVWWYYSPEHAGVAVLQAEHREGLPLRQAEGDGGPLKTGLLNIRYSRARSPASKTSIPIVHMRDTIRPSQPR